jgi:two-component system, OmpR family, catabolic regulation response regulator CreB
MPEIILVVEDESSIADNIRYALSTEGFEPAWCETGAEALQILKRHDVALVLLDVGLPDVNGFELLKEIRRTSSVPIILVTARSGEVDRVVGLEIGADDYVVKPFSPRELTARVRAVLRRAIDRKKPPANDAPVPCGPFRVDDSRYAISYHDVPLELSRYEYRLLRFLLANAGRVYTREQLMNHVWEEPEMSLERTVDTHIKTIRQKLKAIRPAEDPIQTHRGLGYSLKDLR